MTEQEERDWVIDGLECVAETYKFYLHDLATKAIVLLQAHEPRVMTLEEVQALHANDVVWLEDKGNPNIIPGIVRNRHLWPHSLTMVTNFMRGDGCKVTADDNDYGKRWRCWTSRPTDEQREAVKWE